MSAFHGFPELPGQEDMAFCKLNEVYCCANAQYGHIGTFTQTVSYCCFVHIITARLVD